MIPSDYLNQGSMYEFVLQVVTMLGGSAEAAVTVFKSPRELLAVKVRVNGIVGRRVQTCGNGD